MTTDAATSMAPSAPDTQAAYEHGLPKLRVPLCIIGALLLYSLHAGWPDWSEHEWGLRAWSAITTLIGAAAIWLTIRSFPTRDNLFRLPVVFLLFFWLFHLGLAAIVSVAPDLVRNPFLPTAWYNLPETVPALQMAALTMVCLALGASYATGRVREPDDATMTAGRPAVFWIGAIVLAAGTLLFLRWLMSAGGLVVFTMSYQDILDRVNDEGGSSFIYSMYLGPVGALLMLTGMRRERWGWFMLPFVAVMGVLSMIGLRSEAMVPTLISAVVLAKRGIIFPRWAVVVAVVAVMLAIPFIKVVRQSGMGGGISLEQQYGMLDGLAEMGSSIRPVAESVRRVGPAWEPLNGSSYLLPVERQLGRWLGIASLRGDIDTDPRNLVARINREVGAIGFSSVAEAYCNFGILGIPLIMLPLGFLFGVLDRRAMDHRGVVLLIIVAMPFLNMVRNSFIHVPGQMLVGLIILWVVTTAIRVAEPDDEPTVSPTHPTPLPPSREAAGG